MVIKLGFTSILSVFIFLLFSNVSFSSNITELYVKENCLKIGTVVGNKAELVNVYFMRVGAGAFFEYVKYQKTNFICYNRNLSEKTKAELRRLMNRI